MLAPPTHPLRSPLALGLVFCLLGVATTSVATYLEARSTRELHDTRFAHAAQAFGDAVDKRMESYIEIAYGLRSLFVANAQVSRRSFLDAVAQLDVETRHPEIKNLAFTRYVQGKDKAMFEQQVRRDTSVEPGGYPQFAIRPPGDRAEYFVADYLWPMRGNAGIHGLDISAQPANLASMRYSQRSGKPVASGPFDLLQETSNRTGFVLRVPVFRKPATPPATSPNPTDFQGAVAVTLKVWDVIEHLRAQGRLEGLAVAISDRGPSYTEQTFTTYLPLYTDATYPTGMVSAHGIDLSVYGRRWHIDVVPTSPLLSAQEQYAPWFLGIAGLVLSLLMGAAAFVLARAQQRAVQSATRSGQALLHSEARWKFALEGSGDGVWDYNLADQTVYLSPRFMEILGFAAQERRISLEQWLQMVHPSDAPALQSMFSYQLRGPQTTAELEFRLRCQDQGWKWVLGRGRVVAADTDGTPLRIMGTASDNTRRRQAQDWMRIAAVAFEAQEGIVITDANTVILRVNQAFCDITGYSAEELIGNTPRILHSGRHDRAFYVAMWETIHARGKWQGEIWDRRKSGEIYPEWLTISAVKDAQGRITHYVGMQTDITQRKAAEEQIQRLAFFDPLTQLPNRRLLMDRLGQAQAQAQRSGRFGAVLYLDIDNFKTFNDAHGHGMGDSLLQQVGQRLRDHTASGDTVAYMGGDAFVVLLENLHSTAHDAAEQARVVGERVLQALAAPYTVGQLQHQTTTSMGINLFKDSSDSAQELLQRSDIALQRGHANGRGALCFFDPQMQLEISHQAELERGLRGALQRGEFVLHYQPLVRHGQVSGVEALLRWQHPQRGLLSPDQFIPLAEESGLITPLGEWVLQAACTQLKAWENDPALAPLQVSVNISARQFCQPEFADLVRAVVRRSGARATHLRLEVTESVMLECAQEAQGIMQNLATAGIEFALDDFGTGYSSLSYLLHLPLKQLKIDKTFVWNAEKDPRGAAIVRAIIALSDSLGLEVLAEGVETEAQHQLLQACGCHAFQGYWFARPVPSASLPAVLQALAAKHHRT